MHTYHKMIITKIMTAISPDCVLFHTVGFGCFLFKHPEAKTSLVLFKCPFNTGQRV